MILILFPLSILLVLCMLLLMELLLLSDKEMIMLFGFCPMVVGIGRNGSLSSRRKWCSCVGLGDVAEEL